MTAYTRCPACRKKLPVTDRQAGKKCMCPRCKAVFVCPTADQARIATPSTDAGRKRPGRARHVVVPIGLGVALLAVLVVLGLTLLKWR